jgi:hypothetical protein
MAINVPMPSLSGDALLKGMDTGSNMFAKMMNARYNSSLHPSGDVANAMYVEQLKNQYGENDPRYLQAKAAHDMAMSGHQSLMDYRTQLSNLAPYRAATPEEKLIAAGKGHGALQQFGPEHDTGDFEGGRATAGTVSSVDGHQMDDQEAEVYNRALGKKTSDAAIRNKIPYAENVKITMDSIQPEALVQYSGPQGTVKYGTDILKAAMGNPPPEFMKYQEALTSAKTLSKQLRQFWGDSIQPSATDKIDQLTNPSHWNKNPQVALQQFMQLKKITDQELQTFHKAGTSPLSFKDGKFMVGNSQKSATDDGQMGGSKDPSGDFLKAMTPALTRINPKYTPENIQHTAEQTGMSVQDVVKQLMSKAGGQ